MLVMLLIKIEINVGSRRQSPKLAMLLCLHQRARQQLPWQSPSGMMNNLAHRRAEPSQCSWRPDKWEKISQFELVVSSRSAASQINERQPQVWQRILPKQSWETRRHYSGPIAVPSIRRPDAAAEVTLQLRS
ncbi:hypothetical protein AAFF_G00285380 [Aldrovandia affinis]|uniref:Uncharacterized protein n=1 Tax=Aldrovandia affinis TaxID=143900 RepID=A0AAD7X161_9TELE|nr:hypothetical protein AAFF_G00285380 [Aldrovandia affinis]